MSDLIERLEKAVGPDRELDREIAALANLKMLTFQPDKWIKDPPFTDSIDAALTLAEGRPYSLRSLPTRCEARVGPKKGDGYVLKGGEHKCAAIALCIAALKARTELSSTLRDEK